MMLVIRGSNGYGTEDHNADAARETKGPSRCCDGGYRRVSDESQRTSEAKLYAVEPVGPHPAWGKPVFCQMPAYACNEREDPVRGTALERFDGRRYWHANGDLRPEALSISMMEMCSTDMHLLVDTSPHLSLDCISLFLKVVSLERRPSH